MRTIRNFRRFFVDGEPVTEPIDLYPSAAIAGSSERRDVLVALAETALIGHKTSQSAGWATVADLLRATGFSDALLRNALDTLGKEQLVRVEVHTLSRRFSRRPRHELRFHLTAEGRNYLAEAAQTPYDFRRNGRAYGEDRLS